MASSEFTVERPTMYALMTHVTSKSNLCIACNHVDRLHSLFLNTLIGDRYRSHMDGNIFLQIRREDLNMNMNLTAQIYNEALMIEGLYLETANKVLNKLAMPFPN